MVEIVILGCEEGRWSLEDENFRVIRVYKLIEVMWVDKVVKGRGVIEGKEKRI